MTPARGVLYAFIELVDYCLFLKRCFRVKESGVYSLTEKLEHQSKLRVEEDLSARATIPAPVLEVRGPHPVLSASNSAIRTFFFLDTHIRAQALETLCV